MSQQDATELLLDQDFLAEIELLALVMIAASSSTSPLTRDALDRVLMIDLCGSQPPAWPGRSVPLQAAPRSQAQAETARSA